MGLYFFLVWQFPDLFSTSKTEITSQSMFLRCHSSLCLTGRRLTQKININGKHAQSPLVLQKMLRCKNSSLRGCSSILYLLWGFQHAKGTAGQVGCAGEVWDTQVLIFCLMLHLPSTRKTGKLL